MDQEKYTEFKTKFNSWGEEFFKREQVEMSTSLSHAFFHCTLLESKLSSVDILSGMKDSFEVLLIQKRAEALGLSINDPATCFFTMLCRTPGEVTMYISALKYFLDKNPVGNKEDTEITMANIAFAFPQGFLSQKDIEEMWDKQKERECPCGNLLDMIDVLK